jgi:hypothetical protein
MVPDVYKCPDMIERREYLRVERPHEREANELSVRMHKDNKPDSIRWGEWVTLRVVNGDTDGKIVCKIQGDSRFFGAVLYNHIRINKHHRNMLGVDAGEFHTFTIARAPSWCFFWYIYRYHPDDGKRAQVFFWMIGAVVTIVLGLIGTSIGILLKFLL